MYMFLLKNHQLSLRASGEVGGWGDMGIPVLFNLRHIDGFLATSPRRMHIIWFLHVYFPRQVSSSHSLPHVVGRCREGISLIVDDHPPSSWAASSTIFVALINSLAL